MTLTEFLLARIAEDEERARRHVSSIVDRNVVVYATRMLAECEAKRRIVELHDRRGDKCGGHPGPYLQHADYGPGYCERADEDEWELRYLALPYADHPDYRDEWRP